MDILEFERVAPMMKKSSLPKEMRPIGLPFKLTRIAPIIWIFHNPKAEDDNFFVMVTPKRDPESYERIFYHPAPVERWSLTVPEIEEDPPEFEAEDWIPQTAQLQVQTFVDKNFDLLADYWRGEMRDKGDLPDEYVVQARILPL